MTPRWPRASSLRPGAPPGTHAASVPRLEMTMWAMDAPSARRDDPVALVGLGVVGVDVAARHLVQVLVGQFLALLGLALGLGDLVLVLRLLHLLLVLGGHVNVLQL